MDMNTKLVADVSAYASLVCVLSFCLVFGLSHVPHFPQLALSPLQWLGVETLEVVLAIIAVLLRSRIWPISLVVSWGHVFFYDVRCRLITHLPKLGYEQLDVR